MKPVKLSLLCACLALLVLAACAQAPAGDIIDPLPTAAPETAPTGAPPDEPAGKRSVTASEFGLSLVYDPALAQDAVVRAYEPVPLSPDRMFAESRPGYIGVTFPGYALARGYRLPYPLAEPQIMFFRTGDFAQYTTGGRDDYPTQQKALESLLADGLGPEQCQLPPANASENLPYLPWTNAAQVFCAQAKELTFAGGKGVRYLTTFAQGLNPVIDPEVFYTFQGLTDDGQYYVAAFFPVATGVFPDSIPQGYTPDLTVYQETLKTQLSELNAQSGAAFQPSLDLLDEMVQSIQLRP